ncbi:MAG: hypothetical protein WAK22_13240 [Candidatus Sulfotelmatobacter sp.]
MTDQISFDQISFDQFSFNRFSFRRYAFGNRSFPFRAHMARLSLIATVVWLILGSSIMHAQTNCESSSDMDAATRTALTNAALHYYDLIVKNNATALRQSSIPALTADFSGIESTITANQVALAGATPAARPPFLLTAQGTATVPHAEFFCGVFGRNGQTADSAAFYLNGLAPGNYGVVIVDAPSPKGAYTVSEILQQQGPDWKLGGLYIKDARFNGHDSNWFITQAEGFQKKGEVHNAWLYYVVARNLISPLPFMSTAATDKLYDDSQKVHPADFPEDGKTADLSAGATTYKLTELFPEVVSNDLDLIVKYQVPSIADSNKTYESNVAVMKALVAKYPELRDAFASVVARAVDPSGHDYGTMLPMKDIK